MVDDSLKHKVLSITYKSVMLVKVPVYFSLTLYKVFIINLHENSPSKAGRSTSFFVSSSFFILSGLRQLFTG